MLFIVGPRVAVERSPYRAILWTTCCVENGGFATCLNCQSDAVDRMAVNSHFHAIMTRCSRSAMPIACPPPTMTDRSIGPPAAELTTVEVDGCFHIFNPRTHNVVALNDTASSVWRLVTGEYSTGEIIVMLAEHYGITTEAIDGQIRQVLREMAAEGLFDAGDQL